MQMALATTAAASPTGAAAAEQPISFLRGVSWSLRNRSFVLLALSSGLLQGVSNCWLGILSTVLPFRAGAARPPGRSSIG